MSNLKTFTNIYITKTNQEELQAIPRSHKLLKLKREKCNASLKWCLKKGGGDSASANFAKNGANVTNKISIPQIQ